MEASFLEIYNETIRDLLGNPGKEEKHEIKTASGEVVITNLTIVPVTQPRQVCRKNYLPQPAKTETTQAGGPGVIDTFRRAYKFFRIFFAPVANVLFTR